MEKYLSVISAVVLVAVTTVGCAQSLEKASPSAPAEPEFRWKYETGG